MNPEAKEKLEKILELGPSSATEADLRFVNARRTYLTAEQRKAFGVGAKVAKATPSNPGEVVAPEETGKDEDVRVAQEEQVEEESTDEQTTPEEETPAEDAQPENPEEENKEETAAAEPEDEYSDAGDADPDAQE